MRPLPEGPRPRALLALALLAPLAGCVRSIDMKRMLDGAPVTTIAYTQVAPDARQYPDYSPIKANVLVDGKPAEDDGKRDAGKNRVR